MMAKKANGMLQVKAVKENNMPYSDKEIKASHRVKEIIANIESLARLADDIATEANLDWSCRHAFGIDKSGGDTTIAWYNSSESC
jgi:hypothetical protein